MTETKDDIGNIVYVGTKNIQAYVLAVTTQAKTNVLVRIKARGKSISKAVDISQISINKFLDDWFIKEIMIGTEERPVIETDDKRSQRVSYIEIQIQKGEK